MSQYFDRSQYRARRIGHLTAGDPTVIGPYRVLGVLGSGGMGNVYLGQSDTGRRVAIKVIQEELADDLLFRRRFRREVEVARKISALYTAPVVDADPDGDPPWFATAYIEGPSLATLVQEHGPLAPQVVFTLAAGLAEALAQMHKFGLVHRDLKPDNVLLTDSGPHVIDFGIALPVNATRLTKSIMLGTPGFIAPERIEGEEGASAGDIFSLGATLVYAATGHLVVAGTNLAQQLVQMTRGRYDLTSLPAPLRPLVTRCLARNPKDRPTAIEIVRTLVAGGVVAPGPGWFGAAWPIDTGTVGISSLRRPLSRRRVLRAAGGVLALGIGGTGAVWFGLRQWSRVPMVPPSRPPATVLWHLPLGPAVRPFLASVDGIVVSRGGGVDALSQHDGSPLWTLPQARALGLAWGDQVVVAEGSAVTVRSITTREPTLALTGDWRFAEATADRLLLAGDDLMTIDRTGERTSTWRPPPELRIAAAVCDDSRCYVALSGVDAGIFSQVVALKGANPAWTWESDMNFGQRAQRGMAELAVERDLVIVNAGGQVALRVSDGGPVWERDYPTLPGQIFTSTGERVVLIADDQLVGLSRADGKEVWTDEPTQFACAAPDRATVCVLGDGELRVIEAVSGVVLWSAPLPTGLLDRTVLALRVGQGVAHVFLTLPALPPAPSASPAPTDPEALPEVELYTFQLG